MYCVFFVCFFVLLFKKFFLYNYIYIYFIYIFIYLYIYIFYFILFLFFCVCVCLCVFYGSFFALFLCFFCLIFFLISYIVYYKCDCSCINKSMQIVLEQGSIDINILAMCCKLIIFAIIIYFYLPLHVYMYMRNSKPYHQSSILSFLVLPVLNSKHAEAMPSLVFSCISSVCFISCLLEYFLFIFVPIHSF